MHILLLSATPREIEPAREYLAERLYLKQKHHFKILYGGVGLTRTTYALARSLAEERPELVIQAGIAGSFHPLYPPGSVVTIREEILADEGVSEDSWKSVFDLQLTDANEFPFMAGRLTNPSQKLLNACSCPSVTGISVNEITTSRERINEIMERYSPVTESMEGAALHYVCLQENIRFIQLRSISNMIGERDKSKWRMQEAIRNLNQHLIQLIHHLTQNP
jgi:futalosine hydrolase